MSDEEYEVEKVLDKRVKKGGQVIKVFVITRPKVLDAIYNIKSFKIQIGSWSSQSNGWTMAAERRCSST